MYEIWLDGLFGRNAKLKKSEFVYILRDKADVNWIFDPSRLRKQIFVAAEIEYPTGGI